MQLNHSFTVPVDVEQAWKVLRDIERVAPCMPGASIETVDGDEFTGRVKVKVGPMQVTYKGGASFAEVDEKHHRATIEARGQETRGSGTANATVTAELLARGEQTEVTVLTDLAITGKPAQFGRGVMFDVGEKLLGQFADCLAERLAATPEAPPGELLEERPEAVTPGPAGARPAAAGPPEVAPASARMSVKEPVEEEPIDLFAVAGQPVAKRLAWVPAGLVLLWLLVRSLRRRRPGCAWPTCRTRS